MASDAGEQKGPATECAACCLNENVGCCNKAEAEGKKIFFGKNKTGTDERIIGPKSETESFLMMDGWKLDGEKVRLDRLTIKTYTGILRLRKFKPPAAEKTWPPRLNLEPESKFIIYLIIILFTIEEHMENQVLLCHSARQTPVDQRTFFT